MESKFISSEINDLLKLWAIFSCINKLYGVPPISCVPKKGNSLRLVHDVRFFNMVSVPEKFQYENIGNVLDQIKAEDSLVTLDIKSDFHHTPPVNVPG